MIRSSVHGQAYGTENGHLHCQPEAVLKRTRGMGMVSLELPRDGSTRSEVVLELNSSLPGFVAMKGEDGKWHSATTSLAQLVPRMKANNAIAVILVPQ